MYFTRNQLELISRMCEKCIKFSPSYPSDELEKIQKICEKIKDRFSQGAKRGDGIVKPYGSVGIFRDVSDDLTFFETESDYNAMINSTKEVLRMSDYLPSLSLDVTAEQKRLHKMHFRKVVVVGLSVFRYSRLFRIEKLNKHYDRSFTGKTESFVVIASLEFPTACKIRTDRAITRLKNKLLTISAWHERWGKI